jgi:hypothetical protein
MNEADVTTTSGVRAVVGLTGLAGESGGVRVLQERMVKFELPAEFDEQHIEILRRDSELLAGLASRHGASLACLHNAPLRSDFAEARRIANEIGLSEERFEAEGGGFWGWIAAAAVVFAIAVLAPGDSSPPPPPPEPPPEPTRIPDAGGSDAGAG